MKKEKRTDWIDPIVEEVRRHGEDYAAQFENLDEMVLDLRQRQKERGGELVSFSRKGSARALGGARSERKSLP